MPPKKKNPTDTPAEDAGGPFRWTLENERKLLVLTQGRYLSGEDYERLVTVFPGTNLNGVKIKCSRFRVEQRNLYEELGWDLPDGGAVKKTPVKRGAKGEGVDGETPTKKTPVKRGADDQGEDTPMKKPRAPREKKGKVEKDVVGKDEVVKSDEDEVEVEAEGEVTAGVKEEQVDDAET